MTETAVESTESVERATELSANGTSNEQLIEMLVDRVRTEGLQQTGEGGLLQQLTRRVLESALEGEITDHVGYDKHDAAGKNSGNSRKRNGRGGGRPPSCDVQHRRPCWSWGVIGSERRCSRLPEIPTG